MDTIFAVGSIVWVRPRLPQYRQHGWHSHGCWPGILRRIDDRPGYVWYHIEPCGAPGQTVMLDSQRDNVGASPCPGCAAAWTTAGWQGLATASV